MCWWEDFRFSLANCFPLFVFVLGKNISGWKRAAEHREDADEGLNVKRRVSRAQQSNLYVISCLLRALLRHHPSPEYYLNVPVWTCLTWTISCCVLYMWKENVWTQFPKNRWKLVRPTSLQQLKPSQQMHWAEVGAWPCGVLLFLWFQTASMPPIAASCNVIVLKSL